MLHDENKHLIEDDQQNSFLYWGPPISQEWKSLNIDQKTMGISNVPCKPSGIAIILKEPGKAEDDDVTEMFPENGGIGKAGYKAPYDSLNVAYNHEWWTCLGDEEKKNIHIKYCCKGDQIRSYKGRCTRYRNYFRKLCSLVLSTIDAASDDSAFLANIYLANICYPSEPGTVGFTKASPSYRNMDETEKVARFLSLIDWMKKTRSRNMKLTLEKSWNMSSFKKTYTNYFRSILIYERVRVIPISPIVMEISTLSTLKGLAYG